MRKPFLFGRSLTVIPGSSSEVEGDSVAEGRRSGAFLRRLAGTLEEVAVVCPAAVSSLAWSVALSLPLLLLFDMLVSCSKIKRQSSSIKTRLFLALSYILPSSRCVHKTASAFESIQQARCGAMGGHLSAGVPAVSFGRARFPVHRAPPQAGSATADGNRGGHNNKSHYTSALMHMLSRFFERVCAVIAVSEAR